MEQGQGPARRWRVQGRVQGVGFRWFVREEAHRLELRGWVRNEPNGDVLAEAFGSAAALSAFEALLRTGPPSSEVTRLVPEQAASVIPTDLPFPFTVHR